MSEKRLALGTLGSTVFRFIVFQKKFTLLKAVNHKVFPGHFIKLFAFNDFELKIVTFIEAVFFTWNWHF